MEHQVYHVKVVECLLRAAVPFNKLQHFRKLLEETGYRLTDRHHMGDLIPVVLKQEKVEYKVKFLNKMFQYYLMALVKWVKPLL